MTTTATERAELDQAPLSVAVKRGSASQHEQAEHSVFMSALLGGEVNEAGYVEYLRRLRPVYAALESVGAQLIGNPIAGRIIDPALNRLAAIDADLATWAPGQRHETQSPAASAYVERIHAAAAWGGDYLAHHYTRYLGDLSGGLAVGRILDRTFNLHGRGLSFYAFEAIEKPKVYKDRYRETLDAIGSELSAEQRARIVTEVQTVFELNKDVFAELSRDIDNYRR